MDERLQSLNPQNQLCEIIILFHGILQGNIAAYFQAIVRTADRSATSNGGEGDRLKRIR